MFGWLKKFFKSEAENLQEQNREWAAIRDTSLPADTEVDTFIGDSEPSSEFKAYVEARNILPFGEIEPPAAPAKESPRKKSTRKPVKKSTKRPVKKTTKSTKK